MCADTERSDRRMGPVGARQAAADVGLAAAHSSPLSQLPDNPAPQRKGAAGWERRQHAHLRFHAAAIAILVPALSLLAPLTWLQPVWTALRSGGKQPHSTRVTEVQEDDDKQEAEEKQDAGCSEDDGQRHNTTPWRQRQGQQRKERQTDGRDPASTEQAIHSQHQQAHAQPRGVRARVSPLTEGAASLAVLVLSMCMGMALQVVTLPFRLGLLIWRVSWTAASLLTTLIITQLVIMPLRTIASAIHAVLTAPARAWAWLSATMRSTIQQWKQTLQLHWQQHHQHQHHQHHQQHQQHHQHSGSHNLQLHGHYENYQHKGHNPFLSVVGAGLPPGPYEATSAAGAAGAWEVDATDAMSWKSAMSSTTIAANSGPAKATAVSTHQPVSLDQPPPYHTLVQQQQQQQRYESHSHRPQWHVPGSGLLRRGQPQQHPDNTQDAQSHVPADGSDADRAVGEAWRHECVSRDQLRQQLSPERQTHRRRLSLTETLRDLQLETEHFPSAHGRTGSISSSTDDTVLYTATTDAEQQNTGREQQEGTDPAEPHDGGTSWWEGVVIQSGEGQQKQHGQDQHAVASFLRGVGCWPTPYLSQYDLETLTMTEVMAALREDDDFALKDRTIWQLSGLKQGFKAYSCREVVLDVIGSTNANTLQEQVTAHLVGHKRRMGYRTWPRVLCVRADAAEVDTSLHITSFWHSSDPDVFTTKRYTLKGLLYVPAMRSSPGALSDGRSDTLPQKAFAATEFEWVDYSWWCTQGEETVSVPPAAEEYTAVYSHVQQRPTLPRETPKQHQQPQGMDVVVGTQGQRSKGHHPRRQLPVPRRNDMDAFAVSTQRSGEYKTAPLERLFYEDVPADASLLVHLFHACAQACPGVLQTRPSTPFARALFGAIQHASTAAAPMQKLEESLVGLSDVLAQHSAPDGYGHNDVGAVVGDVLTAMRLFDAEGDKCFTPMLFAKLRDGRLLHGVELSSTSKSVNLCAASLEASLGRCHDVLHLPPALFVFCTQPTEAASAEISLHGRAYRVAGLVRSRGDRESLVLCHNGVWRRMDRQLRPVVWRQVARHITAPGAVVHLYLLLATR